MRLKRLTLPLLALSLVIHGIGALSWWKYQRSVRVPNKLKIKVKLK
ncbi:hypothetical protein MUDAN_BIHEEGNE_01699 [Lactiplantibacillus mudanjiangensis]|uniref:Uncharacterized protein n=1 Tax=Lactiplantibacillus mudanjiangensis TaxID=1296538 RepID=A0A660E0B8_9LACO|nr:hypothetical protein MUDAN_BIHEEGNE_01699 [Lactiplantibacillus mudanjiangensis]VDG26231.1 hypothetical protein MUDAN_IGPPGNFN_01585 [Lactiplantibacillus mudanjiangensis]VDG27391.1 hypothetical protein MUDAN_MDHGFNIF_02276 [Lactiplantibacillus mudanjiangensis]VDG33470.1 hypothetical protein MUDAN_DOGOELCO_02636 [Lactiplantibacillus mudanjiangensis]